MTVIARSSTSSSRADADSSDGAIPSTEPRSAPARVVGRAKRERERTRARGVDGPARPRGAGRRRVRPRREGGRDAAPGCMGAGSAPMTTCGSYRLASWACPCDGVTKGRVPDHLSGSCRRVGGCDGGATQIVIHIYGEGSHRVVGPGPALRRNGYRQPPAPASVRAGVDRPPDRGDRWGNPDGKDLPIRNTSSPSRHPNRGIRVLEWMRWARCLRVSLAPDVESSG